MSDLQSRGPDAPAPPIVPGPGATSEPEVPAPPPPPPRVRFRLDRRGRLRPVVKRPRRPHQLRPARGDEAQQELVFLHRRELAELLRQAAALRALAEERTGAWPPFPVPPVGLRSWRRRARIARVLCHLDGIAPPGLSLVERLIERHLRRWPALGVLARTALAACDEPASRLCQAHALLRVGEVSRARAIFAELSKGTTPRLRWRAFEGLAHTHRLEGRLRLALGAMEAAADHAEAGIVPMVDALLLALEVRDPRRAQRAAARLDLLVDASDPRFAWALARVRRLVHGRVARGAFLPLDARELGLVPASGAPRSPAEQVLAAID